MGNKCFALYRDESRLFWRSSCNWAWRGNFWNHGLYGLTPIHSRFFLVFEEILYWLTVPEDLLRKILTQHAIFSLLDGLELECMIRIPLDLRKVLEVLIKFLIWLETIFPCLHSLLRLNFAAYQLTILFRKLFVRFKFIFYQIYSGLCNVLRLRFDRFKLLVFAADYDFDTVNSVLLLKLVLMPLEVLEDPVNLLLCLLRAHLPLPILCRFSSLFAQDSHRKFLNIFFWVTQTGTSWAKHITSIGHQILNLWCRRGLVLPATEVRLQRLRKVTAVSFERHFTENLHSLCLWLFSPRRTHDMFADVKICTTIHPTELQFLHCLLDMIACEL